MSNNPSAMYNPYPDYSSNIDFNDPDTQQMPPPMLPHRAATQPQQQQPGEQAEEFSEQVEVQHEQAEPSNAEAAASSANSNSTSQLASLQSNQHFQSLIIDKDRIMEPLDPAIVAKMHENPNSSFDLGEFIARVDEFPSVIPDSASLYIMGREGIQYEPGNHARLLGLIGQKFANDLLSDAITMAKSRGLGQTNRATKETKFTLTADLLNDVLTERGFPQISEDYTL